MPRNKQVETPMNQGERSDEEKEELEKIIKELNAKFDQEVKVVQLLTTQLKKSQDDLRWVIYVTRNIHF